MLPTPGAGLMSRLDLGRAGLYLKAGRMITEEYDYECRSDGTTNGVTYVWTNGEESRSGYEISGGGTFALLRYPGNSRLVLRLYIGVGYGVYNVLWQDNAERWARVKDLSYKGLAFDAGLLCDIGKVSFMAGISQYGDPKLEFGLGWHF